MAQKTRRLLGPFLAVGRGWAVVGGDELMTCAGVGIKQKFELMHMWLV